MHLAVIPEIKTSFPLLVPSNCFVFVLVFLVFLWGGRGQWETLRMSCSLEDFFRSFSENSLPNLDIALPSALIFYLSFKVLLKTPIPQRPAQKLHDSTKQTKTP